MVNDKERQKLEALINQIFSDDNLIHIFKDLFWGIIRLKEEKNHDAIKNLGECCEHSHKVLYSNLRRFSTINIDLNHFPITKDWEVNEKLQNDIFPFFEIKNIGLLQLTREIVDKWNKIKHEYEKRWYPVFNSVDVLSDCVTSIKILLILLIVFKFQENNKGLIRSELIKEIQLKKINIENEFFSFFNQNDEEIIEFFLDVIFSRNIRNFLFQKSILDSNDILNSKVLQKYLPYYVFNHWRIEKVLNEPIPLPFRAIGPHIADFEIGNWIYIPKIAKYIFKLLNKNRKSILINAFSGTGKTVISRWIGFKFYKIGYNVFYIDCLDHKLKNIEAVLDQIIFQHKSAKKFEDTLFIFDNIHILDNELKLKLNECKNITLTLLTERIFDRESKGKESFRQNFEGFQNVEIIRDHWTYRNTVKGIININAKNAPIQNQIKHIGNQNLWIYAIILKLFKASLEIKKDSSIIEIFTDFDLVGGLITEYFEVLLKKKAIKLKFSELDIYFNHLHYLIGILSLYSEYELWTNRNFIECIISIEDTTPLGTLNSKININKEILMEVQSFLIDIFEISSRIVFVKPGIKELELKIPHSQMAIIYKNCVLKKYERGFSGLIEQLQFLYISYGKYFGSFLQQKHSYLIRKGNYPNIYLINKRFFDFDSYLKGLNYLKKPQILHDQIINNSIEEIDLFFYYISVYNNSFEEELFKNIFQEEIVLYNQSWKSKIEESKPSYLYLLLRRIKKYLGFSKFIDFVDLFQKEIFNIFKQDRGDYIISFLNFFLDLNFNLWEKLDKNISDLIDHTSLNMDDLFSIYSRNRKFFEKISKARKFYPLIKKVLKKLILNIGFEREQNFIPSPYYNYGELFSQIYQEIIEELLTQSNQELNEAYEVKLRNSNLITIINYLKDFYEHNPNTSMRVFKKYLNIIKDKLYESDVDNIETFFDLLTIFFKEEKVFIKESFLSDWKWFEGIFIRHAGLQFFLFSRFRIIEYFFTDLFPKKLHKFKEFNKIQTEIRLQEYYDDLESKIDIAEKLTVFLEDERNYFILNLFNKAIYDSLEIQDLPFYTDAFQKLHTSQFLREKWDFQKFLLSMDFKEKLIQAGTSELKDFFNIYWFEPWRSVLFNGYKDLLVDRFGQDYEFILELEDDFEEHLRKIVGDMDLLEIIKHYNHYNDPFFGKKDSYVFSKLREIIEEKSILFLDDKYITEFHSLKFPDRFNLLLLLKIYHPTIFNEIFNKKSAIKIDELDKSEDIFEVITILEFYKLNFDVLKELEENFIGEFSLFERVLEAIKQIDLASLRYLIQINPAKLLKEYPNIKLSNHLQNSTLLQLSIFLYKPEISISLRIPGHTYIRKMSFMGGHMQKFPFVLELPESELKQIRDKLNFVLWLEDRIRKPRSESISYSQHSDLITEIITKQFTPFSSHVILLIKKSDVRDIAIYFKSLTKILSVLEQKKIKITDKLEKYLISEDFKIKINDAEFYDIYRLFKYLKILNLNLAREIWTRNRKYFTQEAFSHKLRSHYTYRIFNFYDMFNIEHFKFDQGAIAILKKIMNVRPLGTTISYLLEILSYDDFQAFISVFKVEIMKIGEKYSKFELRRILSEGFMRKYNTDSLNTMRTLFQDRLNEQYFFES